MVTDCSGRSSKVAQGGMTMKNISTSGLGDQPPPPRALEQILLQELNGTMPEEVLPAATPPAEQGQVPIEVDDEDMQPPPAPQQIIQPLTTPPIGRLNVPLPDSPMKTHYRVRHHTHQIILTTALTTSSRVQHFSNHMTTGLRN